MKSRKFVSLLCAAVMLLGTIPTASAAESTTRTVPCQIVIADGSTTTTKELEVSVPANASKAEEKALVRAAVYAESGLPSPVARSGLFETIIENDGPIDMVPSWSMKFLIGTATVTKQYLSVIVEFEDLYGGNGAGDLTVELYNKDIDTSFINTITLNKYPMYTYFLAIRENLELYAGNEISVYAYTDTGYAKASSCVVDASTKNISSS
jgi:hypothetical protein